MAKLHDFKIQGQTSADAAIATLVVEYHDDGSLRFATAAGEAVVLQPSAAVNKVLKAIFTGVGGFATGKNLIGA